MVEPGPHAIAPAGRPVPWQRQRQGQQADAEGKSNNRADPSPSMGSIRPGPGRPTSSHREVLTSVPGIHADTVVRKRLAAAVHARRKPHIVRRVDVSPCHRPVEVVDLSAPVDLVRGPRLQEICPPARRASVRQPRVCEQTKQTGGWSLKQKPRSSCTRRMPRTAFSQAVVPESPGSYSPDSMPRALVWQSKTGRGESIPIVVPPVNELHGESHSLPGSVARIVVVGLHGDPADGAVAKVRGCRVPCPSLRSRQDTPRAHFIRKETKSTTRQGRELRFVT